MSDKQKIKRLRSIIYEDLLWMAIRYANSRHTYAPSMIRDAVRELKEIFPDFKLREDETIEPPSIAELNNPLIVGYVDRNDWLDDLFKEKV